MTRIGLISDVHAASEPVAEALAIFAGAGVEQIFCAGDIAGYNSQLAPTIELLEQAGCQSIIGNHDLLHIDHHGDDDEDRVISYLKSLPAFIETRAEGISVYMVHAQPPDGCHGGIKLLDKNGKLMENRLSYWSEQLQDFQHDVLIVGHTHQVYVQQLGNTLVVNPGSSVFNNCCAILSLPDMSVEMFALNGKPIEKTWNWGEHVIYAR